MSNIATKTQPFLRRSARVTISDVSDAIGVTKSTVSRALNGYPDISETTRNRIVRTAEKMGYRPLSHAQAIRTGRTRSMGLVLQIDEHDSYRPFLAGFLAGISQQASAENWTLTVATAETDTGLLETMNRLLQEQKADGFILPRTKIDDPRVRLLQDAEVPFVLYGRTGDPRNCAWYDILGEEAMCDAVLRLARHGHRRIAFVNGGRQYNYSALRLQGYLDGLNRAGLPVDLSLIKSEALNIEDGAQAARHLLRLPEPPTAFAYATDMAALGLYSVAAELGLTVGRQVSVISYDGIPEGEFASPQLTTFSVESRDAGRRLAALLIRRVRGEAVEGLRECVPATLLARGSDGPPALNSKELAKLCFGNAD